LEVVREEGEKRRTAKQMANERQKRGRSVKWKGAVRHRKTERIAMPFIDSKVSRDRHNDGKEIREKNEGAELRTPVAVGSHGQTVPRKGSGAAAGVMLWS
jgi:hypothetical protein